MPRKRPRNERDARRSDSLYPHNTICFVWFCRIYRISRPLNRCEKLKKQQSATDRDRKVLRPLRFYFFIAKMRKSALTERPFVEWRGPFWTYFFTFFVYLINCLIMFCGLVKTFIQAPCAFRRAYLWCNISHRTERNGGNGKVEIT